MITLMDAHPLSRSNTLMNVGMFGVILALFVSGFFWHSLHLTDLRFNTFVILSGTTLITNLALLVYLMRKPARTDERIWLTVYLMGLVAYAFGEVMQRLSGTPTGASFWNNVSDAGIIVAPALYLFTLTYTNRTEKKYAGTIAFLLVASLLFVFFLAYTPLLFSVTSTNFTTHPWGLDYNVGTNTQTLGVILDALWFDIPLVLSLARLISFRRHTRNVIFRRQSLIFIVAVSIPFVGGTISDVLLPLFGANLPPLSITLATPGAILLIYGILRYQVLTISPTLFSNTILAIMQESVVVTDANFNILYINPEAEKMLGINTDSAQKVTLVSKITDATVSDFKKAFTGKSQVRDKATVTIEQIDITRAHGDTIPVRVRCSWLHMHDFDTLVILLTDITAELHVRNAIEHEVTIRTRQLHEARAYLVSSINSLAQGFILVNRSADVELVNSVAIHLFKAHSIDATGHPLTELISKDVWNIDLADLVSGVLRSRRSKQVEATATDGSFYEVYITPVLAGASELGATIVIEDITEAKILDRSKDEFFSIASHELRTPLTAIRGNMSMLQNYFPDAMKDNSLATIVDDAHDASVRLIAIVNDFLDSSKLEQGKMEFTIQPVAVKPFIEAVQGDLKVLITKSQATITLKDLDGLPKVAADETRLRQILYNLLNNALLYSDHGTITISGDHNDKHVRIHVTDTGKGISPENQRLLFHKFQQAGDSILTRDNTKGTGLGLYISRLLAVNMKGDLMLEKSEVGVGSSFVITLPLAKKKHA